GNVGHQRAIALGLAWSAHNLDYDAFVVMDGDGEDTPADVERLVERSHAEPGTAIIAERKKRSEGWLFRLGYRAFRIVHLLTTGKQMRFGNFCLLRRPHVRRLIASPSIWNHFAAGIIQSRIPLAHVPVDRGRRLAGKSHMNYVSLVVHGLSAIAVQLETVAVRLLLSTLGLFASTVIGIGAVVAVRLFTERAIPGWASTLSMLLGLVALQTIFISAFLAFTILHTRTQRLFVPAVDFHDFVRQVRQFGPER
ncbi:MAG: glycosyltransferase, partial [Myxococcota bacterium]